MPSPDPLLQPSATLWPSSLSVAIIGQPLDTSLASSPTVNQTEMYWTSVRVSRWCWSRAEKGQWQEGKAHKGQMVGGDVGQRMKIVVIPIPPSAAPGGNLDHPQQSTSIEVMDGQTQPSMITGDNINQGEEPDCGHTVDFGNPNCRQLQALFINAVAGDMPTPDEHQALEQAELATSDVNDDFLCMLQTFKLQHGSNFPYNKHLDGHIISWVQHVQAGQYTVDMIDLLEVSCHPHIRVVCQLALGYGHPTNMQALFFHVDFEQMRGTRIFPIAHKYFQWLSMGHWIDEWMEEKWCALSRLLGLWDA
ncbi:hypothetical protein F5141DRAFT_1064202 [Pisolithus sp. B1]|nr:hypothetical protein F5141DRAFT_1064202 [Pisolithus sp. B1]